MHIPSTHKKRLVYTISLASFIIETHFILRLFRAFAPTKLKKKTLIEINTYSLFGIFVRCCDNKSIIILELEMSQDIYIVIYNM